MTADGIVIGIGLLAGVAFGSPALLVMLPALLALQVIRNQTSLKSLALLIVCVLLGAARGSTMTEPAPITDLAESRAAVVTVTSFPVSGGPHERMVVNLEQIQLSDGAWITSAGKMLVYLPERGPGASVRDRLFLVWDAAPIEQLAPGYGGFVRAQGASGSAWVWSYTVEQQGPAWMHGLSDVRRRIGASLENVLGGDAGALASGIVTGDDSGLSESSESAFRNTGTSHITAVSGQNVALLLAFLSIWMRPRQASTRIMAHAVMILAVWLYAGMVGLEPPALRAAIVASLTLLSSWFGRRPDPLTILTLTIGVMAMAGPQMVQSAGFWLSASASWALCGTMTTHSVQGLRAATIELTKGVMAANLATLPIILWTFGEWSPISPLANLLVGPILTATFPLAYMLAILVLLPLPIAQPLAWIPGIGLDVTIAMVQRLGQLAPAIQFPTMDGAMALAIALPVFTTLALMSRDGDRWRGMISRNVDTRPRWLTAVASGCLIGSLIAVIVSSGF